MPTIRIDDEVWDELKQRAIPLEDTPNDVLRRVLGLKNGKADRKQRASSRKQGTTRTRKGTPPHQFRKPILQALSDPGGSAQEKDVLDRVEQAMAQQLNDVDRELLASGRNHKPRWRMSAREERRIMARKGLLKRDCPRGIWELTEEGLAEAKRISKESKE